MLGHASLLGRGADLATTGTFPSLLKGGVFGVDIFFVLSGFLITSILIKEHGRTGSISFKNFYARRALRLFPAMALLLLACSFYVIFSTARGEQFGWTEISMAMLYVSNMAIIFTHRELGMLTPTWSLSVEEQFYSIWPIVLLLLLNRRSKRAAEWAAGIALASYVLRLTFYVLAKLTDSTTLLIGTNFFLFTRADSLMCGAVVAIVSKYSVGGQTNKKVFGLSIPLVAEQAHWNRLIIFSAFAMILLLLFSPGVGISVYLGGYMCTSIFTAVLILAFMANAPSAVKDFLSLPLLVWVGRISYGLYLFHVPIYVLVDNRLLSPLGIKVPSPVLFLVAFFLSFAVAAASFHLIEAKILKLKSRFH